MSVALPPIFAAVICERTKGTGLIFSFLAIWIDRALMKRRTVMLSMNAASKPVRRAKAIRMLTGMPFVSFRTLTLRKSKNPLSVSMRTRMNMPKMSPMASQLMDVTISFGSRTPRTTSRKAPTSETLERGRMLKMMNA